MEGVLTGHPSGGSVWPPLACQAVFIGEDDGVYTVATLPSTTYPGIGGTPTVTTPNLLLARPEVPVGVVETVTSALFSAVTSIAREHPEANEINTRTGVATMPVPLHPGALRYFRATKPYA